MVAAKAIRWRSFSPSVLQSLTHAFPNTSTWASSNNGQISERWYQGAANILPGSSKSFPSHGSNPQEAADAARQCVEHEALERYDGVSSGKYTIGLGQTKMGFCNDREDIYSMALTTLSLLLKSYDIDPMAIGRLEVGTETLLDKSKSVKTVLMQLFEGNHNIEGVDTLNACYGGTSALLNSINWAESSAWDGRDAIVVAGDIAIYPQGAARPTGGAGCVAMLIGPDAPLVIEPGMRGSYMAHTYDFYKADLTSEYALVDGHYSIQCYMTALDECYKAYKARQEQTKHSVKAYTNGHALKHANGHPKNGHSNDLTNKHFTHPTNGFTNGHAGGQEHADQDLDTPLDQFNFMCFHSPTTKIVAKSYARLLYNDYVSNPEADLFRDVPGELRKISVQESLNSKLVEKTFAALAAKRFAARVHPSTLVGTMCGNIYTASVYGSLISLICNVGSEHLQGKRVGVFSFGSGLASTMFSLRIKGDISAIAEKINLHKRLKGRRTMSPEEFVEACSLRERAHLRKDFVPSGSVTDIVSGTYYLDGVDGMFRRTYQVK